MASRDPETTITEPVEALDPDVAAAAAPVEPTGDLVSVRVLKKGDGEIFTGRHERGEHTKHARGDIIEGLDRAIADQLEDRGFAEIV